MIFYICAETHDFRNLYVLLKKKKIVQLVVILNFVLLVMSFEFVQPFVDHSFT